MTNNLWSITIAIGKGNFIILFRHGVNKSVGLVLVAGFHISGSFLIAAVVANECLGVDVVHHHLITSIEVGRINSHVQIGIISAGRRAESNQRHQKHKKKPGSPCCIFQ